MAATTKEIQAERDRLRAALNRAGASDDGINDAVLVRRYEAMRGLPRSTVKDKLLREIEGRARNKGLVYDPKSHVGYQFQKGVGSVVRVIRNPHVVLAAIEETKRLKSLARSMRRQVVES